MMTVKDEIGMRCEMSLFRTTPRLARKPCALWYDTAGHMLLHISSKKKKRIKRATKCFKKKGMDKL